MSDAERPDDIQGADTLPPPTHVVGHGVDVPGLSITGYHLLRELGRGGMGIVYAARDERTGQVVALKTMQSADPAILLRFKHEFRALAELNHNNLVTLYRLEAEGPVWIFTMELLEGAVFLEHVRGPGGRQGPLSPAQFDRLRSALAQLCDALETLHGAAVIHRDLKPSNIMVTDEGRVVVLDFGLAADLDRSGQHLSHQPRLLGTVGYMAPEQAACQPVGPASDWYSVGVILFEALTGRLPFVGRGADVLMLKQHQDAPDPALLVPGLPGDLARLCRELLARDPASRAGLARVREVLGQPGFTAPTLAAPAVQQRPGEVALVGRRQHLDSLVRAYESVRQDRTTVVALHGRSGVGKSALVRHFLDDLDRQGEAVLLVGRCYEQESVPYKALDSLIDSLGNHLESLPAAQIEALLPRDVSSLVRVFPVLRHLEIVASLPRRRTDLLEPQEVRRRALASLRELLARLGDRRTLVLAIDDLQWGDEDSVAVLDELLQPPDPPLLLLACAYRDEDVPASQCLAAFTRLGGRRGPFDWVDLPVEPLNEDDSRELARALLGEGGGSAAGAAEVELVARQSGGFPFFVHELARHLAPSQPSPLALGPEPSLTLEEVLWRRAQRLPERARRLLEVVAVAGRPLGEDLACAAAGLTAVDPEAVALLRAERLVRVAATPLQQHEVETYHDRIRETVVGHLADEVRIEHHRRLAEVLEAHGADPEWRAVHFLGAGDRVQAGCYFSQAADRAAEALAFDQAARLYRQALELLTGGDEEMNRLLRIRLGDSLAQAGRAARAARELQAAAHGADPTLAQELRCRAAHLLLASGHIDAGLAALQDVLAAVGLSLLSSPRRTFWGLVWQRLRLRLRGLRFRRRSASEVPPRDLARLDACAAAAVGLAMVDTIQGSFFQARALRLALDAGEPARLLRALSFEAGHESIGGTWSTRRTTQLLEAARELAGEQAEPPARALVFLAEGVAAALEGDWLRGCTLCDRAEAIFRESCLSCWWEQGTAHRFALWPLIFMGELAEVGRRLPALIKQAREREDLYGETNLCLVAGTFLLLAADQPALARQELAEVMARWSQQGFHVQHMNRLYDDAQIDLYEGQPRQAWQRLQQNWRPLERSQLLRVQQVRIFMTHLRGRAALALSAIDPDPALVQSALRDARALRRERAAWSQALSRLLEAGAASRRGAPAAPLLRDAIERCDKTGMRLFSAAARWHLARLEGEASQAHCDEAEAWMRGQQVARPDRMAALLVPGVAATGPVVG